MEKNRPSAVVVSVRRYIFVCAGALKVIAKEIGVKYGTALKLRQARKALPGRLREARNHRTHDVRIIDTLRRPAYR